LFTYVKDFEQRSCVHVYNVVSYNAVFYPWTPMTVL